MHRLREETVNLRVIDQASAEQHRARGQGDLLGKSRLLCPENIGIDTGKGFVCFIILVKQRRNAGDIYGRHEYNP